jgi:PhnB protein
MTKEKITVFFAPHLYIKSGCRDIDFYLNGMGATELKRWSNSDGSIHVSELSIHGCIFHLHEEKIENGRFEPIKNNGVTSFI